MRSFIVKRIAFVLWLGAATPAVASGGGPGLPYAHDDTSYPDETPAQAPRQDAHATADAHGATGDAEHAEMAAHDMGGAAEGGTGSAFTVGEDHAGVKGGVACQEGPSKATELVP